MSRTAELKRAYAFILGAFLLTVVLGLLSSAAFHDDDLTHFLMARWSRWFPAYLLHVWGRPGFTLPHAALAGFGDASTAWHVCRILSAGITAMTALIAVHIARRLDVRPVWAVPAALYAQPMATLLACTTLTENVAGLYLTGAVALALHRRPIAGSLLFSVALVTRYELIALLPVWWWLIPRRPRQSIRSPAPPATIVAASVAAPLAYGVLLFALLGVRFWDVFAQPAGSTDHPPAGLLAFVPQALLAVPPALAALALVGLGRLAAAGRWLIPAVAGGFVLLHFVIRSLGLYASGGYARFLVTVAPLLAVLIVAGAGAPLSQGFRRRRRRSVWLATAFVQGVGALAVHLEVDAGRLMMPTEGARTWIVGCAVAVALLAVAALLVRAGPLQRLAAVMAGTALAVMLAVQWGWLVRPLRPSREAALMHQVVESIGAAGLAGRPIFATNPWVAYDGDLIESPRLRKSQRLAASMPPGTLVIWDAKYSPNDYHRLPLAFFSDDPAYRVLRRWPEDEAATPEVVLFEKLRPTPVPPRDPPAYPPDVMGSGEAPGWYYIRWGQD